MSHTDELAAFRRFYLPFKERVCEVARPCSHGQTLLSPRRPDYWEFNCVRLEQPVGAAEMVALADRELAGCAHRLVEWAVPMPDAVATELRRLGWIAEPLVFMRHQRESNFETTHGSRATTRRRPAVLHEVDFDAVRDLREIWHREDFGEAPATEAFFDQAREVAELAGARVLAAVNRGVPLGFAQVESHDGGVEIAQVFVHPDHRGDGLGTALTVHAVSIAGAASPVAADASPRTAASTQVWICAERGGRPRRLYERLGFRAVTETGIAILPPGAGG